MSVMDASKRRAVVGRVARGGLGVVLFSALTVAAVISVYGLTWFTLAVAAVCLGAIIFGAIIAFVITEGIRGTFQSGD
jgi:hypothetical protein